MKKAVTTATALAAAAMIAGCAGESEPAPTVTTSVTATATATETVTETETAEPSPAPTVTTTETITATPEAVETSEPEGTLAADDSEGDETSGQRNARGSAQSYLEYSSFSRDGLIDQLEYEGFTYEQAEYGANQAY